MRYKIQNFHPSEYFSVCLVISLSCCQKVFLNCFLRQKFVVTSIEKDKLIYDLILFLVLNVEIKKKRFIVNIYKQKSY